LLAAQEGLKGHAQAHGHFPEHGQGGVGARAFDLRERRTTHAAGCSELVERQSSILSKLAQTFGDLSTERGGAYVVTGIGGYPRSDRSRAFGAGPRL
jgi:hypothetical protein